MPSQKRERQFFMRAACEQMPDGLDRAEPHPRRSARGKDTVDQLFPQTRVVGRPPDLFELVEARAYLRATRAVRGANLLDRDRLSLWPHSVRQSQRRGSLERVEILWSPFQACQKEVFGTTVAFGFYGTEAVHASRTMSFRIKVFARLTLPSKICARRGRGGLCYHGAPFCLAAIGDKE